MANLNNLLEKLCTYIGKPLSDPRVIWLLLGVDHRYIEQDGITGILNYEAREYGCVGAMGTAFIKLLTDVSSNDLFNIKAAKTPEQQEACVSKIEARMLDFHKLCVDKVSGLNPGTNPGEYRQTHTSYVFHLNGDHPTGTRSGYSYLNSRPGIRGPRINGATQYIENFYTMGNNLDGSFKILSYSNADDIKSLVKILILRLVQDLQVDNLIDTDVLLYICEFIQDMTLLHPFADANNRTLVNLLLNEILLDTGFGPVIFNVPNIFYGFKPHELVTEVCKAQQLLVQVVEEFDMFDGQLIENRKALLRLALRSDSPELITMTLPHAGVPNFLQEKFTNAILSFKTTTISPPPVDLFNNKEFLKYFLSAYDGMHEVVFASTILLALLNDNVSGHLSWHLDFFIKYFFDNNIDEHIIIDGYFYALTFITYGNLQNANGDTLLDTLFSPFGSGNSLYNSSKNRTSIIFRCIDWYTNIKGLNPETKKSIDELPELLDRHAPAHARLSYEDRRKIDIRIENVFSQKRNRSLTI